MSLAESAGGERAFAPELGTPAVRPSAGGDDAARDAFVRAHPRGSVFHLAGWRRAVARAFGHEGLDLCAWRGAELAGVLPLMRCRGPAGRSNLLSVPYGVYGGPLGRDAAAERALVQEAVRLGKTAGVGRVELRCREDPALPGLAASDLYVTFRRALPAEPEGVLAITPKDERRLVRRARDRHGLELCEGPWYAADLARLFLESKRRLGSPGLPMAWFRALLNELGAGALVHVARRGSEPVAACMSFAHEGTLSMYYIGTAPGANRAFAATSFLVVELQEWAVRRGFCIFDLGRSRKDAGAVDFKRNQGFEPAPLHYRYALVQSGAPPSFTPSNPRTALLRRAWARLPLWAAQRLSARLARYLP